MERGQSGFSLTAAAIAVLTMGILIAAALHERLSARLLLDRREVLFIQARQRAMSSLNWGFEQSWPAPGDSWFCLSDGAGEFRACVIKTPVTQRIIMKAQGNRSIELTLYSLAQAERISGNSEGNVMLKRKASGLLDFYPDSVRLIVSDGAAASSGGLYDKH